MKLYLKHVDIHWHRAAVKRSSKRNRPRRRQGLTVKAPNIIDLYKPVNHEATCLFLATLRARARPGKTILICFRNTVRITAAGGLLMLSEVDSLLARVSGLRIACTFPPRTAAGKYRNAESVAESVLQRIGFFKLIGKTERRTPLYSHVQCWAPAQGSLADGSLAGKLLAEVEKTGKISKSARLRLYRGAIEAIANCVDHAYPPEAQGRENRWWMFVGSLENHLSILVCDLGVGIPATLPFKHPESVLEKIFEMLGVTGRSDGELIRASTYIKRTRTQADHRGKGGADLRSLIDHYPEGYISIFSRRGNYTIFGSNCDIKRRRKRALRGMALDVVQTNKAAIRGTIIEWGIPFEALERA